MTDDDGDEDVMMRGDSVVRLKMDKDHRNHTKISI